MDLFGFSVKCDRTSRRISLETLSGALSKSTKAVFARLVRSTFERDGKRRFGRPLMANWYEDGGCEPPTATLAVARNAES